MLRATGILFALALACGLLACSDDDSSRPELPEGIPTFTGAELLDEHGLGVDGAFSGTWETTEDVQVVRDYFARELADGPWRIVESREVDGGVVIIIEHQDDPSREGVITVRRSQGSTRIVTTIGGDDSARDADDGGDSSDPGEETVGRLPPGYPSDSVPLPESATIVVGSAPVIESDQYFLVEFTTADAPADLIAFFNQELPENGWTAGTSNEGTGAFILNFQRGDDQVTVTGGGSADGTSASVTLIISQ